MAYKVRTNYVSTDKRIGLHGKPSSGKSTLAATLSKNCPAKLPAGKKTILKDTLWIPFDKNATTALRDVNLQVDEAPWEKMMADAEDDITVALDYLTDFIYEQVEAGKTLLVPDTCTKLDLLVNQWWNDNPIMSKGNVDGFGTGASIRSTMTRFHENLDQLTGVDIVWCMHSKPASESSSAQKKARAQAVAGSQSDIQFAFFYKETLNAYRNDNDLILMTECLKKSGKYEYACYVDNDKGFETKSRYRNSLPPGKLPCNLKAIYNIIDKGKK